MKSAEKNTAAVIGVLQSGQIIAHPTESSWGLGCDPQDAQAIKKLLKLKRRGQEKGLILVAGSWQEFAPSFPHLEQAKIDRITAKKDHPCTWLVEDRQACFSALIRGNHTKVAIRITSHQPLIELTNSYGKPIVSTSANPTNQPPAFSIKQVIDYFGPQLCILKGPLGGLTKPSHIRDLDSGEFIRY